MSLFGRSVSALYEGGYEDKPSWPSNWHPSPIKRESVLFVLSRLREVIPHDRWYIGGSIANPEVAFADCSDIDIFFYTMSDYALAQTELTIRNDCRLERDSNSADTYNIKDIGKYVQLVKRHAGTPQEIFDTFDINVAKHLVRSDGQYIQGEDAEGSLRVINPNSASVSRMQKYVRYLRYSTKRVNEVYRNLIDDHIGNDTLVEDYYTDEGLKQPPRAFNKMVYNKLKYDRPTRDYLNEKALEHAPELLI